jgi:hypothetical protein
VAEAGEPATTPTGSRKIAVRAVKTARQGQFVTVAESQDTLLGTVLKVSTNHLRGRIRRLMQ